MAYYDWVPQVTQGESSKLGLVLCLHVLTGSGCFFDELAAGLSEAGCRVVYPDMEGRARADG